MITIACILGKEIEASYSKQIEKESHIKGTYLCRCRLQFRPKTVCISHSSFKGQKTKSCSDCTKLVIL